MKTIRTTAGPFSERPYFKSEEIEEICREALCAVKLYPAEPGPIRIDRFVEKRFGVHPVYEDLPGDLLGYTEFGEEGVRRIVISRSLDEEGSKIAERRIHTTLAHEAGHGLLHAHLFARGADTRPLFGDAMDPNSPRILCREEAVPGGRSFRQNRYDGRWWEFQANRVISGLLLPRLLVEVCLGGFLVDRGSLGGRVLPASHRDAAARLLSDVFDVNPVVAKIRLDETHPLTEENQLTL